LIRLRSSGIRSAERLSLGRSLLRFMLMVHWQPSLLSRGAWKLVGSADANTSIGLWFTDDLHVFARVDAVSVFVPRKLACFA
jgi:hypothetical protein